MDKKHLRPFRNVIRAVAEPIHAADRKLQNLVRELYRPQRHPRPHFDPLDEYEEDFPDPFDDFSLPESLADRIKTPLYQEEPEPEEEAPFTVFHHPESMDQAVHSAFYMEGGIRFYANNLTLYVLNAMAADLDTQTMWINVYCGCIEPMLTKKDQLEQRLMEIRRTLPQENLEGKAGLMSAIRAHINQVRVVHLRDWEHTPAETYRKWLTEYANTLSQELLQKFPPQD